MPSRRAAPPIGQQLGQFGKPPRAAALRGAKNGAHSLTPSSAVLIALLGALAVLAFFREALRTAVTRPARVAAVGFAAVGFVTRMLLATWRAYHDPSLRKSQSLAYHAFADDRCWCCGVPNSSDVLSNLPFLFGVFACAELWRDTGGGARAVGSLFAFGDPREVAAPLVSFGGVALVACGSAYYHWRPNNHRLVWDRLPMTIAFMCFLSALLSETVGVDVGAPLLPWFLAAGAGSVAYWHLTDDLTPYAAVQFGPLFLAPFLLVLFEPRYSHNAGYGLVLLLYAAAKATESGDAAIYRATGKVVSGHTLKHLLAAAATVVYWAQLRARVVL